MFRDNKREIFGFRKYKAYGLASAVIAAFFLMGGVASADEVTSARIEIAKNKKLWLVNVHYARGLKFG